MSSLNAQEIAKLQTYLQTKLGNKGLTLKAARDGAELSLNGEFLGTVYKDEEDGETAYDITIAVLDIDLQGKAA